MREFGGIHPGALVRIPVAREPDTGPDDAHQSGGVEDLTPAPRMRDPEQQRGERRHADVLADKVNARRHASLALRKPDRHHAVVHRERRRFGYAHAKAHAEQRDEA